MTEVEWKLCDGRAAVYAALNIQFQVCRLITYRLELIDLLRESHGCNGHGFFVTI